MGGYRNTKEKRPTTNDRSVPPSADLNTNPAAPISSSLSTARPGDVLTLQSTIGNQAVQRLVQQQGSSIQRRQRPGSALASRGAMIQRVIKSKGEGKNKYYYTTLDPSRHFKGPLPARHYEEELEAQKKNSSFSFSSFFSSLLGGNSAPEKTAPIKSTIKSTPSAKFSVDTSSSKDEEEVKEKKVKKETKVDYEQMLRDLPRGADTLKLLGEDLTETESYWIAKYKLAGGFEAVNNSLRGQQKLGATEYKQASNMMMGMNKLPRYKGEEVYRVANTLIGGIEDHEVVKGKEYTEPGFLSTTMTKGAKLGDKKYKMKILKPRSFIDIVYVMNDRVQREDENLESISETEQEALGLPGVKLKYLEQDGDGCHVYEEVANENWREEK